MKSRFLMSIIVSAIVLNGFGSSNIASAQNLPSGSIHIPQELIDRVCKPGNFDWALRNHFKGIRLTSQQGSRLKPVYENYRKELRDYLKSNECMDFPNPTFKKEVFSISMKYDQAVRGILTQQQIPQWSKNMDANWKLPEQK